MNKKNSTDKKRRENNKIRGMKLLTQEIRRKLPLTLAEDCELGKVIAYVKFFTPDSSWTWWAISGKPIKDKNDNEVDFWFYGLVDGYVKEFGPFLLSELESARGPMGLPIERDLYWQPKTLEEIAPELFKKSDKEVKA